MPCIKNVNVSCKCYPTNLPYAKSPKMIVTSFCYSYILSIFSIFFTDFTISFKNLYLFSIHVDIGVHILASANTFHG